MQYVCNICRNLLNESEFAVSDNKRGRRYECKTCYNQKRHQPKMRSKARKYENGRWRTVQGRIVYLIRNSKSRAIKKGLGFDLTSDHIMQLYTQQNGACKRTGIEFDLTAKSDGSKNPKCMTLDRIDNTKGYTLENTELVCYHYNIAKNSFPIDELYTLCELILDKRHGN